MTAPQIPHSLLHSLRGRRRGHLGPLVALASALALPACVVSAPPRGDVAGGGTGAEPGTGADGTDGGEGDGTLPDAGGGVDLRVDPGCQQDPGSRIPCRFEGLPDPEVWSVDPQTGLRFRRVTALEQETNGWPASAYLAEASAVVDGVEEAAATLPPLLVPIADDEAVAVELEPVMTQAGPIHVEVSSVGVDTAAPTFVSYVSRAEALPEILMNVVGTVGAQRGLSGWGTAGGMDVEVATYAPSWFIEELSGGPEAQALARTTLRTLLPEQQEAHEACNPVVVGGCAGMCAAWKPADCDDMWDPDGGGCVYEGTNPCVDDEPKVDLALCDNGIDDDDDGWADLTGVPYQFEPDPHCQHAEGCFAQGTGSLALHQHRHESGEPFVFTGNLDWCGEDGDWPSRMFRHALDVVNVYDNPTGHGSYDGLGRDEILRYAGGQCWTMDPEMIPACEKSGACAPFGPQDPHPYVFAGADYDASAYLDAAWDAVAHAAGVGLQQPATISVVLVGGVYPHIQWDGRGRFPWSSTPGAAVVRMDGGDDLVRRKIAHEIGHTLGLEHDEAGNIMSPVVSVQNDDAFTPENAARVWGAIRTTDVPRGYSFGK